MNPQVLQALSGISSVLGLLAVLAYFYTLRQGSQAERSVRDIVEGDQLFNADQIVKILSQFSDDGRRLDALEKLTDLDRAKAQRLLTKVKANVDVKQLQAVSDRHRFAVLALAGGVLLLFGVLGLLWAATLREPDPPTGDEVSSGGEGPIATQFVAQEVTFETLPQVMREPLDSKLTGSQLRAELSRRRSLVLDGTTVRVGQPNESPQSYTLALHTLQLKNGARILTYGNTLSVTVVKLDAERGAIRAFPDETPMPPAGDQQPGRAGLSGGRVVLASLEPLAGKLVVDLTGQTGGAGGAGAPGPAGPGGRPGDNASQSAVDCSRGAGNGDPGRQGGPGLQGAQGGPGGKGGVLILAQALAGSKDAIEFLAAGGRGGEGGRGGPGGPGGPGGSGGREELPFCRGNGQQGPQGAQGERGPQGARGPDGSAGQLSTSEGLAIVASGA